MATGSSSSSCSASNSWSILLEDEARHSPIRYRIGPLDYQPPVYCKCNKKAALWISWSDDNLGRRYAKCYKARDGGCDFMGWYEGPVDPFVATLLVDLRDEVWTVKKQRAVMKQTVKEVFEKIEDQEAEIDALKKEVARLQKLEGEHEVLEDKVKELAWEKKVLQAACVVVFAVALFMRLA
ncbi:hypothetical protein QOZ80_4AG0300380 [Eleusine coracana subsp. coracana]|nr:hypothetical protein QOZ80_4AG0300380 [Eleusine coracana subsp. coracana]